MKYFKPDKDWQYNSRVHKSDNKWLFYGEGYREASELIEKQILEIDRKSQDLLIYPYCYLIRHYIEIRLKEVIDEGSRINQAPIDPSKGGHDLWNLWMKSQEILKKVWEDQFGPAPLTVSEFIKEFHTIDVKSDNFRYPIDKKGNETLENINEINFRSLAEVFQEVKNYLDGVTEGLAVVKDNISMRE